MRTDASQLCCCFMHCNSLFERAHAINKYGFCYYENKIQFKKTESYQANNYKAVQNKQKLSAFILFVYRKLILINLEFSCFAI